MFKTLMHHLIGFLAGIDTSRFTLTFAMMYMAKYPHIQAKAQKEIDSVVGKLLWILIAFV